MTTEAAGTVAHPQVAQSSHLFHNASDFEIFGGHYILGDVHNHHEAPRLPPENPLSFAEEEAFSDSDIYCGQMLRKRRGFPLYEPAPQANLPAAYQTHGVSIGDVGSITSEGMFDFFFNIFLPSDHPINGSRTPTGFSPTQLYEAIDVSHFDYDPASHVSTSSVQRLDVEVESSDPPGDDFIFDCDAPQGAILALPHGAHLKKLRNVDHIRTYAAKHAANWYEYINGPRGRGLANGELYIVTGCEKAPSWGMASYHASRQDFQLKFNRGVGIPNTQFRWSGTPGQKNPSQRKHYNRPLGENQPSNHTTFVHGLSVSIGKRLWKKLFGTVPVESSSIARFFNSKNGSSAGVSSKSSPGSFLRNFFGAGRSPSSRGNGTGRQHGGVVFSNVAPIDGLVYNPSRLINEYILTKIPETTIAISHDDDWSDILSEVSEVDSPEIFLHHIEGQFGIMGSDGPTFPLSKAAYTTARFAALTSDNSFNTSGFTPENISRPFPSPPTVSGDISLDGLQSLKYTFRQIEPRGVMSKEREGDYTVGNVSNNDAASQRRMLSMPSRNGSAARRKMPVLKHRRLQPKDVAPPHPSYDSPMPTSSFLPIHAPEQRLQPQDVALPHISYDSSIMPTFSSLPGYAYAPQTSGIYLSAPQSREATYGLSRNSETMSAASSSQYNDRTRHGSGNELPLVAGYGHHRYISTPAFDNPPMPWAPYSYAPAAPYSYAPGISLTPDNMSPSPTNKRKRELSPEDVENQAGLGEDDEDEDEPVRKRKRYLSPAPSDPTSTPHEGNPGSPEDREAPM